MPRMRWSHEKIIEEIRKLSAQGHPLNMASVRRTFSSLVSTACSAKYFGSWRAAVEAAGFNYDEVLKVRKWTREKIIEEIKRLHREGIDLRPKSIIRVDPSLLHSARDPRYFGSWRAAVEAAGIDYQKMLEEQRAKEIEQIKQRIIDEIQRMYREGRLDELSGAWKYHTSLFRRARHRFGSWRKAIEAAGLDYEQVVRTRKWSRERIIEEIKRLHQEGKDLSVTGVQKEYPALLASAQSAAYFGSWRAAVEAAGIDYTKVARRKPRSERKAEAATTTE